MNITGKAIFLGVVEWIFDSICLLFEKIFKRTTNEEDINNNEYRN